MDKDFTPKHDKDLCATCSHAFIREDINGHKEVICTYIGKRRITAPTVKCKDYNDMAKPELYDLEKIAWIITADPKGKVGFRPIKEMDREEKQRHGLSIY